MENSSKKPEEMIPNTQDEKLNAEQLEGAAGGLSIGDIFDGIGDAVNTIRCAVNGHQTKEFRQKWCDGFWLNKCKCEVCGKTYYEKVSRVCF